MNEQNNKIRDQQRTTWNEFSPMWKKWDDLLMSTLNPITDEIIHALGMTETDIVLDIASGTGEPGLTLATKVNKGKVILTDLSENMLEIAKENAAERKIENIEIRVCDACDLPYPDKTFNAVSSRLGFMFFPDMRLAAKEMYRVLKPGGKIAAAVWDIPEKNFWATAIAASIMKNMQLSPPSPESPGLFRCAKSGVMQHLLQQAGFRNVFEKEVSSQLNFENVDEYWTMITEVTPPLASALDKADEAIKGKIKNEVFQVVANKYPDGKIYFEGSIIVICGEK